MPRSSPPQACGLCTALHRPEHLCPAGHCRSCHHNNTWVCAPRCEQCFEAHAPLTMLGYQALCPTCISVLLPNWQDPWRPLSDQDRHYTREAVAHTEQHEGRFWYADTLEWRQRWPSARLAALEVECCGAATYPYHSPITTVAKRWGCGIGSDGSLPGEGFELRTSPAGGDFLFSQLQQLGHAFEAQDAYVNERAGMHCHVDCRDFDWLTAARFIKLYARLERVLFFIASPGRAFNHYCQPCGHHFDRRINQSLSRRVTATKRALYTDLYGTNQSAIRIAQARSTHNHNLRYRALNAHSWLFRGTMEVRIHPGELRGWAMFGWAALLATITDLAYSMRDRDLDSLFPDVSPVVGSVPDYASVPLFSPAGIEYVCGRLRQLTGVVPPTVRHYIAIRWNELYQSTTLGTLSGPRVDHRSYYTLASGSAGHRVNALSHGENPPLGLSTTLRGKLAEQLAWIEAPATQKRLSARRAA